MFKKFLATAILVCSLPVLANAAWMFNTQAKNAGGTIDTPKLAGQTVASGNVFKTYTTHLQAQAVTVTADTGYTISKIVKNGVTTLNPASPYATTVNGGATATTANSLFVTFQATKLSLTASVTNPAGGSASPTSVANIYPGKTYAPIVFRFTPKAGYFVSGITGTAGYTVSPALPGAVNQAVTVTIPTGTVLTSGVNLVGTFGTSAPVITAGAPQTVAPGALVTLNAADAGSSTYAWLQTAGPAVTLSDATALNPTFTPTVVAEYKFLLTATSGAFTSKATATVSVAASILDAARTQCNNCHVQNNVGVVPNVFNNWSASTHRAADLICYNCHVGANSGGHPGIVAASTCAPCHGTLMQPPFNPGAVHSDYNCAGCHANSTPTVAANHDVGVHGVNGVTCTGCHKSLTPHTANIPVTCSIAGGCHGNGAPLATATKYHPDYKASNPTLTCAACHSAVALNGTNDAHGATRIEKCIECHASARNAGAAGMDNDGVRSITQEFTKWSHHVTGVELNDAHCASCHLEGKRRGSAAAPYNNIVRGIILAGDYHMNDKMINLRNADTDANIAWDPANPNHSAMDTFCMSCHDADGATSAGAVYIQGLINLANASVEPAGPTNSYKTGINASPTNPFGDTISNRYDKMKRPAVVDVSSQFNTTNNSHHAVKGPRYTGRTRTAGARQITSEATFAANSSATLWGKRSTIYDSVNAISGVSELATNPAFNALYVPLENAGGETAPRTGAAGLGDDSTLHCGDCHTVGQWKAGTAKSFNPTRPATEVAGFVSPAIGAHGSNNEYMLRNSRGTDERHTQDAYVKAANGNINLQNPNAALLVCFNCHSYGRYGSVYNATGTTGPHAGEYDASGRCNGVGNTIPFNGYTTGTATDGTQFVSRFEGPLATFGATPAFAPGFPLNEANRPATGEQNPDFGNIFGIQCSNCHNSGVGNGYGGIHGSANNTPGTANTGTPAALATTPGGAFVDGMGNVQKVQRFLPGLGNVQHVPGTLGGITGGTTTGPITNVQTYSFTTGGVSNDTNWEQVAWQQVAGQPVTVTARAGAGCYTLTSEARTANYQQDTAFDLKGQSVDGGATIPEAFDTWGGCDDHNAKLGAGNHGFIKRINRPVTY